MTDEIDPGVLPGIPEYEAKAREEAPEKEREAAELQVTMHECSQCGLLHTGREREPMTVDTLIAQNHQLQERSEKLERSLIEFEARLDAAIAESQKRKKRAAPKKKAKAPEKSPTFWKEIDRRRASKKPRVSAAAVRARYGLPKKTKAKGKKR